MQQGYLQALLSWPKKAKISCVGPGSPAEDQQLSSFGLFNYLLAGEAVQLSMVLENCRHRRFWFHVLELGVTQIFQW